MCGNGRVHRHCLVKLVVKRTPWVAQVFQNVFLLVLAAICPCFVKQLLHLLIQSLACGWCCLFRCLLPRKSTLLCEPLPDSNFLSRCSAFFAACFPSAFFMAMPFMTFITFMAMPLMITSYYDCFFTHVHRCLHRSYVHISLPTSTSVTTLLFRLRCLSHMSIGAHTAFLYLHFSICCLHCFLYMYTTHVHRRCP